MKDFDVKKETEKVIEFIRNYIRKGKEYMRKKKSVRLKLITGLILMALLLVVVLTGVIERLYRSRMEEYYSQVAFNQASIAAEYIDGDSIEKYYKLYENGKLEEYLKNEGYSDDAYECAKEYIEEKGKSLVKRSKH